MGNIVTGLRDVLTLVTAATRQWAFGRLHPLLVTIANSPVGEKLFGRFFGGLPPLLCSVPDITSNVRTLSSDVEVCGGFADMYFGEWRSKDVTRKIAIKLLRRFRNQEPAELIKRLDREVSLMRKAHHPNIAQVFGISYHMGGRPSIVMPRYHDNARNYVLLHPQIDKLQIMCDILQGLVHLHSLTPQIFHGDLKASNILIAEDGKALIGDFGSSEMAGETMSVIPATARYQPPEILRDSTPMLTAASDIWSLGCTLCEIWVSEPPYAHRNDLPVLFAIVYERAEPFVKPKHITLSFGDDLWVLFRQCWAQDPDHRPSAKYIEMTLKSLHSQHAL